MKIPICFLTVLCIIVDIRVAAQAPVFKATYYCDGLNLHLEIEATAGNIGQVYPNGQKGCASKFPINGKIATASLTTADAAACGYSEISTAPATNKITVFILEVADVIQSTDGKADFTCTANSKPTAVMTAAITGITGGPGVTVTPDNRLIGVTFKVISGLAAGAAVATTDAVAAPPLANALVGDLAVLAGYLDKTKTLKELKIISCTMVPTGETAPELKLVASDGCPDTTHNLYKTTNEQHAKPVGDDTGTTDKYVYITAPFKVPRFYVKNELTIKCTVDACVDTTDIRCNLPTGCNGGTRRRRRSIVQSNNTATIETTIRIMGIGSNQDKQAFGQLPSFSSCLNHVSFISVVAILAVLLVVSLAVSVFFCTKLIRQNNNNQLKEAYPNPGYKA